MKGRGNIASALGKACRLNGRSLHKSGSASSDLVTPEWRSAGPAVSPLLLQEKVHSDPCRPVPACSCGDAEVGVGPSSSNREGGSPHGSFGSRRFHSSLSSLRQQDLNRQAGNAGSSFQKASSSGDTASRQDSPLQPYGLQPVSRGFAVEALAPVERVEGHTVWEYLLNQPEQQAEEWGLTHRAVLVDAAGTLVQPTESCPKVYRELGLRYGVKRSEEEILARYRWAYSQPWKRSRLRYVADGREFWRFIVTEATGCSDPAYFEELYEYYATAQAWELVDPRSAEAFAAMRAAGLRLAVVSNFDTRLRDILHLLGCDTWFDFMAVSAEVQFEKPNPTIFLTACELLGVEPRDAVHIGDDRRNDVWGARGAGCDAWLWGSDVTSFAQVAERIGVPLAKGSAKLHA